MVDCALKATLASRQLWCRATWRGDVSVFNCEMEMGQGSVWGTPKCEVFWLVSLQLCCFSLAHISLAMLHSQCLVTLFHVCALQLFVWPEIPLDLPGGYEEGQHHTHVDSAHAGAIEILNVVDSPCPKLHFHMDGSCQSSCCRFVLFSGTMIWVCCSQLFCDCKVVFAYGVHSWFCWVVKYVL